MIDIIKIIGIGFVTVFISIILKEYKKDFSIYVVLIGGIIIFYIELDELIGIVNFIKKITLNGNIDKEFVGLLIKITGISILTDFAINICKDAGENSIASKIDFGGKIIVISLSIPVIGSSLEQLLLLLPS